jgi:orotidine-5'-phosphate decarboxylase
MNTNGGFIAALDGIEGEKIVETAKMFGKDQGIIFKVNDALDDPGPQILTDLLKHGETFADAKYDDIPDTMDRRVTKIARRGPKFITIQASNSVKALKAAVDARANADILAVTVLTSIKEEECQIIFGGSIEATVLKFARNALIAGVQGIVCSAAELEFLGQYPELDPLIKVTPAIRPLWYQKLIKPDDQNPKRTMTPSEAFALGADYLVMGRPLLKAPGMSPAEALDATIKEIKAA